MITLTLETEIEDGVSSFEVFKDGKHVAVVELYYDYGDTLCDVYVTLGNLSDEDIDSIILGGGNVVYHSHEQVA